MTFPPRVCGPGSRPAYNQRTGGQRGATEKFIDPLNFAVQPAPKLNPEQASVELAGARTASVVKLGDSFIAKTTNG